LEPFAWNLGADLNGGRSAATPGLHSQARRSGPLHTLGAALRRFRPNPTASVLLENDKPVHIRSGEISGKVVDERGPYSLSGNWWHEKVWARAEWDLQLEDGILCRCHESEGTWEADGVYD